MWNYDARRMFFCKLKIIGKLIGLLAILIFLLGVLAGITFGAYYVLFKLDDRAQLYTILIALPILIAISIILELPNLRRYKIGDYFNKYHIANKLIRGYIMTWVRFYMIIFVGMLGLMVIFTVFAIALTKIGLPDKTVAIIAGVPAILFAILFYFWNRTRMPQTYGQFLANNAPALEERIVPDDSVRD